MRVFTVTVAKLKPHLLSLSALFLLTLLSVLVWLPTRFYPYHWDAAGFVINASVTLKNAHFQPLIATGSDFAHPPFFIAALAAAWDLFGQTKTVSHLLILPFVLMLIISTYLLGKKTGNTLIGFAAALALLVTPVVLAEVGNIYIDLPSAALGIAAVAALVYNAVPLSILFITLAILTKESLMLLLPLLALLLFYPSRRYQRLLWLLVPTGVLFIWYLYHHAVTGWWLVLPGRPLATVSSLTQLMQSLTYVGSQIFFAQARFLVVVTAIVAFGILLNKRIRLSTFPRNVLFFAGTVMLGFLFYAYSGEFALRYAIVFLPMFYLTVFYIIYRALTSLVPNVASLIFAVVTASTLIAFIMVWRPVKEPATTFQFRPPEDVSYIDQIHVFRQLGAYADMVSPDIQWYGSFPENLYLTQPYQGYVTSPVSFHLCSQFQLEPQKTQYLILHPYAPEQIVCQQLLHQFSTIPIYKFTHADKWIELYQVTASAAASLTPSIPSAK